MTDTNQTSPRRVVIIGGVAGGASCAARLRRLDESAHITMLERGPYISFANCGLPYHLSGVIEDRDSLLVQTPEKFEARFHIDVRVLTEALSIDPDARTVRIRDLSSDQTSELPYDDLVLSPGARPFLPPIDGIDLPEVHALRTIPDMDGILDALNDEPRHVTVVGAGFIGLEVAENLHHRGIPTAVIEMGPQVMPGLDPEISLTLTDACLRHGVDLRTSTRVTAIRPGDHTGALHVDLDPGTSLPTDLVIMAVGVRPENELARTAGLTLGPHGHILVDRSLRTSQPHIYAIGDAVEVPHRITGVSGPMPLAGPANRQGRLVADNICGLDRSYRGPLGTSIIQVFDTVAACTGISQKTATAQNIDHLSAWIYGHSHASYYPGSQSLALKAIFDPHTGRLLGAQGFGSDGVDKRLDVLATAIAAEMTVFQLEELDLCYAPPFSSAKDPVNHLGAVAAGMITGTHPAISPMELSNTSDSPQILDVRTPDEVAAGTLPDALAIPLDQLRDRLSELDPDRPIVTVCKEGLRGYLATRVLHQSGFTAHNLLGGYRLWSLLHRRPPLP